MSILTQKFNLFLIQIMNNKKQNSPGLKSNESEEKRTWIMPELSDWNTENLENGPGPGPDGGAAQTYNA